MPEHTLKDPTNIRPHRAGENNMLISICTAGHAQLASGIGPDGVELHPLGTRVYASMGTGASVAGVYAASVASSSSRPAIEIQTSAALMVCGTHLAHLLLLLSLVSSPSVPGLLPPVLSRLLQPMPQLLLSALLASAFL